MNNLLELNGRFEQKPRKSNFGPASLPSNASISKNHLDALINQLTVIMEEWKKGSKIDGALVSVYYDRLIAKSNRLKSLFKENGDSNNTVVGAKYSNGEKRKHIITHYMELKTLQKSIDTLVIARNILLNENEGKLLSIDFDNKKTFSKINFKNYDFSESSYRKVLVDSFFIEKFAIDYFKFEGKESMIVSFYDTKKDIRDILSNLGIVTTDILEKDTIRLKPDQLKIVETEIPYLVSMSVKDLNDLSFDVEENIKNNSDGIIKIKEPTNEPIIGVVDTLFFNEVYFKDWVESYNVVDGLEDIETRDYRHGTGVTSIIVDGPRLNPWLDDGCGNFKVRHFGVSLQRGFSSYEFVRNLEKIISNNRDIKVWNLSLGSNFGVKENYISIEASILDKIQYEYDVVFIVAGTNLRLKNEKKIGAPADSINSIVVNSVNEKNEKVNYSREGVVLSFFTKPDVSYYGGSDNLKINVCEPFGVFSVMGTSYAAPWITRKVAYLINVLGFSKEVAKALIIDSAIDWEKKNIDYIKHYGNGVVPKDIKDIIKTDNSEIKFIVSGVSQKYETYNFRFPIPEIDGKFPYVAKATLCYFPKCTRNQGVDYTNTELDIYFGRLKNGKVQSVDKNLQSTEDEIHYMKEEDARKLFRKWDNIKFITNKKHSRNLSLKSYGEQWGLKLLTKERIGSTDGINLKFGIVVTLKELNNENRIEDFIQSCHLNGWVVNQINVNQKLELYNTLEEELTLE